ncbi:hypothetical protein [Streptomyces sp. 2P-4]|uniref:hypothetical protein n=1 Tax=Streptomyces sp. 2P-4 TaxID=2931974 RepID=UPI002540FC1F|nr:hypothetical protein [Streptomyces sp. 2P-4]
MPGRSKRKWWAAAAGVSAAAVVAGAFLAWNTDFLGEEVFCDGAVASGDLSAVLDTQGRLSTVSSEDDGQPGFSCTVERKAAFFGGKPLEIEMETGLHDPDFAFQTAVWKDPSSMAYFSNGATGAVSGKRGWVLLPEACAGKVDRYGGGRSDAGAVRTVEAVVKQGTVDRTELARTLVRTAQRVADKAGCAAGANPEEPRLQAVNEAPTDPGAVCGLPGFALPAGALVKDAATLGKEQVSGGRPGTWACGLHLAGDAKGVLWFSASSDPQLVDRILLKGRGFDPLPGGAGVVARQQHAAVLTCETSKVYVSMRGSTEYLDVLYDRGSAAPREVFQAFVDAAVQQYRCPAVRLPQN